MDSRWSGQTLLDEQEQSTTQESFGKIRNDFRLSGETLLDEEEQYTTPENFDARSRKSQQNTIQLKTAGAFRSELDVTSRKTSPDHTEKTIPEKHSRASEQNDYKSKKDLFPQRKTSKYGVVKIDSSALHPNIIVQREQDMNASSADEGWKSLWDGHDTLSDFWQITCGAKTVREPGLSFTKPPWIFDTVDAEKIRDEEQTSVSNSSRKSNFIGFPSSSLGSSNVPNLLTVLDAPKVKLALSKLNNAAAMCFNQDFREAAVACSDASRLLEMALFDVTAPDDLDKVSAAVSSHLSHTNPFVDQIFLTTSTACRVQSS